MFDDPQTYQFLAIIFAGTLARATFGFGDALVAMPFLLMLLGWDIAAPLIALISASMAFWVLLREWRSVDFRGASLLIGSAFVGIVFGLTVFPSLEKHIILGILGGVLAVGSGYALLHPKLVTLNNDRFAPLFGVIAGVLSGAYNTAGPPLVMYGAMRQWSAQQFRATLQAFFLPTSVLVVLGHGLQKRLTFDVGKLFLLSLAVLPISFFIGHKINSRFRTESFTKYLHGFLLIFGCELMIDGIFPGIFPL